MQTKLTFWSAKWWRVVYSDLGSELYSLLLYAVDELEDTM
jgi:hypothetical protein